MKSRRSNKGEAPDNSNMWLLTYADVITLTLTFFILLFSFSTLDAEKWRSVVGSLQGALGASLSADQENSKGSPEEEAPSNTVPKDESQEDMAYQLEEDVLLEIKRKIEAYLVENSLQNSITVNLEERGLVLRFLDSILFERGKAEILPQALAALYEVVKISGITENHIRIEGHTDNLAIQTAKYPSNWELSVSRATNVLRFMNNQGIQGEKLAAVGYGEYRPLVPNTDEENRRQNRRVDIVIIRKSMSTEEP